MLRCVKIQAANKSVPRTTSHHVKYNILKGKCEWNHPPPVGTTTGPEAETWATPCTVTTVRGTLWLQANWVDNTDSCTVGSIIIWAGNSMYVPVRQIVDMMTDRQQAGCKATKLGKNGHKANRHLRHGSLGTHIWLFANIWKYLNSDIQPVLGIRLFYIVKICK